MEIKGFPNLWKFLDSHFRGNDTAGDFPTFSDSLAGGDAYATDMRGSVSLRACDSPCLRFLRSMGVSPMTRAGRPCYEG